MSYPSQYGPNRRAASRGGPVDDDFWGPIEAGKPDRGGGSRDGSDRSGGYGGGAGREGPDRGGSGRGGSGRGGSGRGGYGGGGRRPGGSRDGRGPLGREEKTGWRRFVPSWKMMLAFAGLGTLGMLVLVGVAYAMTPIPSEAQSDAEAEGSVVYYAGGKTPLMRIGRHRESVPLNKIPEHVQTAVLAAEDRGFYTEPGVSPKGISRAIWKTATGGDVTGGSTITQQMARNYYEGLSQERSVSRKFKEILISVRLGKEKPKDYILGTYLNTVYFGRQAYGIQAAARAYFGTEVSRLNVSQSAMLAAIIQQPAYFHTQGNDAAAQALRERWGYVLDGMVTMGKLSPAERAEQVFPKTRDSWSDVKETGQSGYIAQRIAKELEMAGIPESQIGSAGLKIHTSLDPKWMTYAEQAVRMQGVGSWPKSIGVGLVAVDPKTGAVKAFYGGNWKRSQFDSVWNPSAQVGSSFKPYVLAAALKQGDNVKSMINGKSPQRFSSNGENLPLNNPGGYLVRNDEGDPPLGVIDLVRATQLSVNTAYVKLGLNVGLEEVAQTAEELGIPKEYLQHKNEAGMSLGTDNIPAAYQAAAFAAFANGGTPVKPHLITKITNRQGETVGNLPWAEKASPALTQEQAAQATYAMKSVVARGTATRAALPGREVAGKTGTTDKNRAAWFVGYVPQMSTAVTMFNTKNKPMTGIPGYQSGVYGGEIPAQIWKNFMLRVTESMPPQPFQAPAFTGNRQLWDSPPPQTPTATPGASTSAPTPTPDAPAQPGPTQTPDPALPLPRPTATPTATPTPTKTREANVPGGP